MGKKHGFIREKCTENYDISPKEEKSIFYM